MTSKLIHLIFEINSNCFCKSNKMVLKTNAISILIHIILNYHLN